LSSFSLATRVCSLSISLLLVALSPFSFSSSFLFLASSFLLACAQGWFKVRLAASCGKGEEMRVVT
jgi:hypothetical protein